MTERSLLELIAAQVGALAEKVDLLATQVGAVTVEVASIKKTVVRIENDHGSKLNALFDGYKLNADKLDRIAAEVSKHEEVILRRIR